MALRDLQNMLSGNGFPCGKADGIMGRNTAGAVARFQSAYCGPGGYLAITGRVDDRTEQAIKWMQDHRALVTHFSIDEIACHHCGRAYVKRELLSAMFKLREHVGHPVGVASAYRCEVRNAQIGGAPFSQHLLGMAFDPTNVFVGDLRAVGAFTAIGSPAGSLASNMARGTHADLRAGNAKNPLIFYDASNK